LDAMDQIEDFPQKKLTQRLIALKEHVANRLQDPGQRVGLPPAAGEPTDDPAIDSIRELIAASRWQDALEQLDSLKANDSPIGNRRQALAQLYRAVILSESGPGKEQEASAAFEEAISLLGAIPNSEEDEYRAHNNLANFLLGRAIDRLH